MSERMRVYHVALLKRGEKVVVQMREDLDQIDCEAWKYMERRWATKRAIERTKALLLQAINLQYGTAFSKIEVD